MVLRALVATALLAGCGQSLFDNNVGGDGTGTDGGTNGSGDGGVVASSCPAGCIGDAAADFDGSRTGWRYVEDARDRTWAAMSPGGGGYTGAVSPNAIASCEDNGSAPACTALPGALLVTTAGATSDADPALEFTSTSNQVIQISVRVAVPAGQPEQQVRLYRNSREDVLFTAPAAAGSLFERAISLDALAGDRFLLAIAPPAMGAANVGVHMYVNATGEAFPKDCQLAVGFNTATGNTVPNACGAVATYVDYDGAGSGELPPVLGAGPFPELGMAADIPLTQYYTTADGLVRSGDSTVQLWVRHDAFDSGYTAWAFSDIDLDATGGIDIGIFESSGKTLAVSTCKAATPTTFELEFIEVPYPNDANWHFIRATHSNGQVRVCVDGVRVGSFPVPAGKLQSPRKPMMGRNQIWTPAGAFLDGGIDDVRAFAVALPCD